LALDILDRIYRVSLNWPDLIGLQTHIASGESYGTMNSIRICRPLRVVLLAVSAFAFLNSTISTATFSYTNVDLVAGFRRAGGSSDLVVDLGPVPYYEGLPLRTVVNVTNVQASLLTAAFPNLNDLSWSISAAMRGNTNYPQYPLQTIWVSSPRPNINTPGLVYVRKGQFTQGTIASQIDSIGAGAVTYGNSVPAGTNNTQTGIVISSTDGNSYTTLMTTNGDFAGTFQSNAENTTPSNFSSGGTVSRSVLYKLLPGSGGTLNIPGTAIGFFDFGSDGSLTFTAGPPPERTTITSLQLNGRIATISSVTVNSVSYRLRFTDGTGLTSPVSAWNTNGTVIIGNGSVQSLQDTSGSSARFYAIEAF
jgi:hypothetical protein